MSRPPRTPRPRRTGGAAAPLRRAGGARLPGIRPTALPAAGGGRLVPPRRVLRGAHPRILRFQQRRHRRPGGLRAKLDYLEWLGVDCLWLLPFYPSPMRDGGYDISDFLTVNPDLGSLDDLVEFLDDAHRRGIRVIADLVMNHTSDQHPWFIESRSSRRQPQVRLVRVERRRPALARGPRRVRGRRDLQLDLGAAAPAVLLAPLLLASARSQLREPGSRPRHVRRRAASGSISASTASASTPCRISSRTTARRGRTSPRPTPCSASCARRSTPPTPTGCCWPRPTSGRPTSSTTSATATSATCASTSRSCPGCSWPCGASSASPSPRSWPRRRTSPRAASGPSSCATTTSSRSRRSPRKSATTWWPST